jgi:ADP-heptose:LPS heptosyltransferase/GT2 family glycosyltransferase
MIISLEEARVTPRGILQIRGWAAGYAQIEKIDIILGEDALGSPDLGVPRPDIAGAYPDYVNAGASGFFFQGEIGPDQLTVAEVSVRVKMAGGVTRSASRPLTLPSLIRRRNQASGEFFHHCEKTLLTADGHVRVDGWAACSDVIKDIEIHLDQTLLGLARLGQPRPDVGNFYPSIPSARTSGFYFDMRLDEGEWAGEHVFTLLMRSEADTSHQAIFPVLVAERSASSDNSDGDHAALNDTIRFNIDEPKIKDGLAVDKVTGALTVIGWALARAGIANVAVFLDEAAVGSAYYGIRRHDIAAAFPDWGGGGLLSGYAITLPKRAFTADRHTIRVVVTDKEGDVRKMEFAIEIELADDGTDSGPLRTRILQSEVDLKLRLIEAALQRPAFTLGLLVRNDTSEEIERARHTLKSLRNQCFQDFRIHLLAPESATAKLTEITSHWGLVVDLSSNSSEFLDSGLSFWHAAGRRPFYILVRAGDRLGVDALMELALEAVVHPEADFIYADERRIDHGQKGLSIFFKPEWSPDLLLSTNYVGRPWCASLATVQAAQIRVDRLARLGEYDLTLRLTERAQVIRRTPLVLAERSTDDGDSKRQEVVALTRAMRRRGIEAEIVLGCIPGLYRVKRRVMVDGMVSIIMPTIAARGLVEISIASIRKHTRYRNFEIICIDNIKDPDSEWKPWLRENADVVVEVLEEFNWSRFNNIGAQAAHGDFLLFLNDDIEVLDAYWLDALLEHAQQPDVGVVGPQLLYPDRRVQHAGIFLTNSGGRHAFRFSNEDEPGPFGLALAQRNVSAVTGACMLISRTAYDAVGGFNESHSVVNNDLDYCLQAWRVGQRVVYTPYTKLIHHELASRAKMEDVFDTSGFRADWRTRFLLGDPFFHPRLSLNDDNYVVDPEPTDVISCGHPILARDKVRRILVQKLDHIGDFITALPAIGRLQERFPKAEIYVLVPKSSLSLTYLEPAIVGAVEFNFFHVVSGLGLKEVTEEELEELRKKLAPYEFDIAIDLRQHGNTRHVLKYSGARLLAGFDYRGEQPWLDVALEWEGDVGLTRKRSHVADGYIGLVEAVSSACESNRQVAAGRLSRKAAFDALMASPKMIDLTRGLFDKRFVCVHPSAGNDARQWPPTYFASLIDLLIELSDVNIVLIGAPSEMEIANAVLEEVSRRDRVWNLIGKTGIADVPNLMVASALFVGNNSGPHHIAACLGTPTIGIHSNVVDANEWGPLGMNSLALQKRMSCGPCYLAAARDCHRSLACLRGLLPAEVFRQCQQFLSVDLARR